MISRSYISAFRLKKNSSKGIELGNEYAKVRERTQTDTEENTPNFAAKLSEEISQEKQNSLEDGRITKAYFERLKMIEFGCLAMSLTVIGLSVIQYELEFDEIYPIWSLVLLYLIFAASVILAILTTVRYKFQLQFKKKRNLISHKETLYSTGDYKWLIFEIVFVMVIPYPWLQGVRYYTTSLYDGSEIYYHVNDFIQLVSTTRLIIVLRVVLLTSAWNSNRSQRLCEMYAVEPGILFTLRCVMETSPFFLISVAYLGSIPFFGYMLRIGERPMDRVPDNSMIFEYANSMWNIIITMTTVGYGDYFPKTLAGRAVIFLVSIWGTTIVSLMVVTLTNIFQMNRLEGKAFTVLNRLTARETLKREAAYVITNLIRTKIIARKTGIIPPENMENLKRYLKSYNLANRLYRELSDSSSGFEEMERQFEFLRDQVKSMHRQQTFIIESNKLVMRLLGVDPKLADKLDDHLKSTVFKGKTESTVEKKPEPDGDKLTTLQADGSINEEGNRQQINHEELIYSPTLGIKDKA